MAETVSSTRLGSSDFLPSPRCFMPALTPPVVFAYLTRTTEYPPTLTATSGTGLPGLTVCVLGHPLLNPWSFKPFHPQQTARFQNNIFAILSLPFPSSHQRSCLFDTVQYYQEPAGLQPSSQEKERRQKKKKRRPKKKKKKIM